MSEAPTLEERLTACEYRNAREVEAIAIELRALTGRIDKLDEQVRRLEDRVLE